MPSTLAIRKVDTNSVFAIGYLYWTISRHGLILETSFNWVSAHSIPQEPHGVRQWQK